MIVSEKFKVVAVNFEELIQIEDKVMAILDMILRLLQITPQRDLAVVFRWNNAEGIIDVECERKGEVGPIRTSFSSPEGCSSSTFVTLLVRKIQNHLILQNRFQTSFFDENPKATKYASLVIHPY